MGIDDGGIERAALQLLKPACELGFDLSAIVASSAWWTRWIQDRLKGGGGGASYMS